MANKPKKPRGLQLKKLRVPGATITYAPTKSNDAMMKKLRASLQKKQAAREARKAQREANPPDLTPRPFLVAYIDILGFGRELEKAATKADLERAYRKVRRVQQEFEKATASDDVAEQEELNATYGRRVIALSDAIVVAVNPDSPARAMMGLHELFGWVLYEIVLAQTRCLAHGIFLRGGISHGFFFFEDDVLLSPALARAYELESQCADYPIIVIPQSTRDAVCGIRNGRATTRTGADTAASYFTRHGSRVWRNEPLYHLDYARLMVNESHRGLYGRERAKYIEAKRAGNPVEAQAALNRSGLKDSAYFLRGHRKAIETAFRAASSAAVRRKYRWLMRYHNRCFPHGAKYCKREVIDLTRF
jgi:hypothetical protein